MPSLLFELGCEELPATFVDKAVGDLAAEIVDRLGKSFNQAFAAQKFATPRRLIVSVDGIPQRQEDSVSEVRGPSIKASFDAQHNPLPPLIGFCKSQGVDPTLGEERDGYVWISKAVVGKSAMELLATILPDAVRALSFEKSMRWGEGGMRFARPIRWLVASIDGESIDFEIQGVKSGLESRGHRFYAPEPFLAPTLEQLLTGLRHQQVEPDPASRREMIVKGANALGVGDIAFSDSLLEENIQLNEWPVSVAGEFREDHLNLPEAVLVTAMAKHEKMFPVRDGKGQLTSSFIFVRNGGEDQTVRQGAEWVLNARLDDAQFFFNEDRKKTLSEFLDQTERIVFQAKLGSVKDRAERLHDLTSFIASRTGASEEEIDLAARAGLFAKADLSTGLVSELPSLQGVIGGDYSAREGFDEAVCFAIAHQYELGRRAPPTNPSERTAWRLAMADAIDKLAGFLGIGEVPSGSSDPFGLRRAASSVIELSWSWPEIKESVVEWVVRAVELYQHGHFPVEMAVAMKNLDELMRSRYENLLETVRYDVRDAVLSASPMTDLLNPTEIQFRCECMRTLIQSEAFVQTATRPINLVESSRKKKEEFDGKELAEQKPNLDSPSGIALAEKIEEVEKAVAQGIENRASNQVVEAIQSLEPAINLFFEDTMVMAEDRKVRQARLSLLDRCAGVLLGVGNFSKIVLGE